LIHSLVILASLSSVAKLPYEHAQDGISYTFSVVHKALGKTLEERIHILSSLIYGYFSQNGHHININVFDKETLQDAIEHPEKHPQLTVRVSNEKTLLLAKYLSDQNVPIWIRHVVVPTITDCKEDIHKLVQFIESLKTVEKVDFLPYHSMGRHKWQALGLNYPLEGLRDADDMDINKVNTIFAQYNIKVVISTAA